MKSPTSYFNGSILWKNLTRFAPLWVLYTIFWLLLLFVGHDGNLVELSRAVNWASTCNTLAVANILYAGICAFLLFGDLFKSRMCYALHAMPLRREGWMLTHSLSALLFALVPYGLTAACTAATMPNYAWVAGTWFAIAMVEFVFFFGIAAFSIQCAGNWLGAGAVYFIINFFFLLAYGLYYYLYRPMLFGIAADSFEFTPLVPLLYLSSGDFINLWHLREGRQVFDTASWVYLFVCGGIGLIVWGICFPLYRRRKLECAGDFVAFRPVAPVFLVFYTLGVSLLLSVLAGAFDTNLGYILLAIGIVLGFFTGKMMLEKQVKVFTPKAFLQILILAVVLAGSLILTWLDPLGITYYVPKTEEIKGMRIYASDDYYLYKNDSTIQNHWVTDPEQIEALRQMHTAMTQQREVPDVAVACEVNVTYDLTDGSICKRSYCVDVNSPLGQQLELHLSDFRQVFFTNDWQRYTDSVKNVRLNNYGETYYTIPMDEYGEYIFTDDQLDDLFVALKADCDAGNMAQDWSFFHNNADELDVCWLYVESDVYTETKGTDHVANGTRQVELLITDDCVNTLIYLESLAK